MDDQNHYNTVNWLTNKIPEPFWVILCIRIWGETKLRTEKWRSLINQVTRKLSKQLLEILLLSFKKKILIKGHMELWGLHNSLSVFPILRDWSFVLYYSSCSLIYPCCLVKVTNSLLVLGKKKVEQHDSQLYFSFSCWKKSDSCVWLDKTFNWEEALLIGYSVKWNAHWISLFTG